MFKYTFRILSSTKSLIVRPVNAAKVPQMTKYELSTLVQSSDQSSADRIRWTAMGVRCSDDSPFEKLDKNEFVQI